jgi:hypothetical protein
MIVLVYTSNNISEFQLLHILINIWYGQFFLNVSSSGRYAIVSLRFFFFNISTSEISRLNEKEFLKIVWKRSVYINCENFIYLFFLLYWGLNSGPIP